MNRNNLESLTFRAKAKAKAIASKIAVGTTALVASGAALAQQSTADVSAVQDEFDAWKVVVVGLVIGYAVVLWAIRAANLAKPK